MTIQAPIEIDQTNPSQYNACSTSCSYSYNYATSKTVITKQDDYIKFDYDNTSDTKIMFNSIPMRVQEVRLYNGSLTKYTDADVKAELIIHHVDMNDSGTNLLVYVPITSTSEPIQSNANEYMKSVVSSIPLRDNQTTDLNRVLQLNDFILERSFFVANTTLPYSPGGGEYNSLYFDAINHSIKFEEGVINSIQEALNKSEPEGTTKANTDDILYNSVGAHDLNKSNPNDDDIYIDCRPTGDSLIPLDELQQEEGITPDDVPFTKKVMEFFKKYEWIEYFLLSFLGIIFSYFFYRLYRSTFTKFEQAAEGAEAGFENSGSS